MVEKRGLAAEAFLSHQLLCVQRTVGPPELGVAFAWDFAGASVIRHSASTPRVTHMHYRAVTRADVFCAPAIGGESMGIVLLEAMASGIPVVASNIDGYATVITPGVDGLLTTPRNSEELALAIGQLLENHRQRDCGLHAREGCADAEMDAVSERYMPVRCARNVKALWLRELLGVAVGR